MLERIKNDVRQLMSGNNDGHGFDHIERVYELSMKLAAEEKADKQIVGLAALLHDVDDYKLFGDDNAENLTNARRIMEDNGVDAETAAKACDIISNMGYSKALKGIRPQTLEGQIVSDADMLDAIGANGIIRTLAYALERCRSGNHQIFDENIWPELKLTAEEYKKPDRQSDNFINHFFEKLLKLKNMMFTSAGRKEAEVRHKLMAGFLYEFFRENGCPKWIGYLSNYENSESL